MRLSKAVQKSINKENKLYERGDQDFLHTVSQEVNFKCERLIAFDIMVNTELNASVGNALYELSEQVAKS
jgi:hypothetical protein